MSVNNFTKNERLKSNLAITKLFKKGGIIQLYPLRILYFWHNLGIGDKHQILFAIPKHKVKSAVARNKLKRVLRETYRLHKHILYTIPDRNSMATGYFQIAYIYTGSSKNYNIIKIKALVINALHRLKDIKNGIIG